VRNFVESWERKPGRPATNENLVNWTALADLPQGVLIAGLAALVAVGLAIDLRQIVPHTNQMTVLGLLEHSENFLVRGHGRAQQRCRSLAVDRIFVDGYRTEQKLAAISVVNSTLP